MTFNDSFNALQQRTQRVNAWVRGQIQFTWLDTLDSDYRDWRPDPPIWERLIR